MFIKQYLCVWPGFNSLIEGYLIISEMLDKVLKETNCSFEVALAWCTCAKNQLPNLQGFSPFRLVFGQNPKLLTSINDKPRAPAYIVSQVARS